MPDVPDALVERDTGAIVDGLELDAAVKVLCDVADDVEDREHRLLGVGLTRQRDRVPGKGHEGGEQRSGHHGYSLASYTQQTQPRQFASLAVSLGFAES